MELETLVQQQPTFRTQEAVLEPVRAACEEHADVASFHPLGESEEGRPLYGIVLGEGPQVVSLIAGAHADEPVGPETLRTFILEGLARRDELGDLFSAFRFVIVPHINPDGEAHNQSWMRAWPDVEAYLDQVEREAPGRDLEFGFPAMRQENRLVAGFLRLHAPLALHMSLHGMGFSEGAMLLIERHWSFRTQPLRDCFAQAVRAEGLRLHDHNRKGEKGFFYIEPGFTTTPEGAAMRTFFLAQDDPVTAQRFHNSSMEMARSLGGDPLCLVTELPLFVLERDAGDHVPGVPSTYLRFRDELPELRVALQQGRSITDRLSSYGVRPLPLETAMQLQLQALAAGLKAVGEARS